MSDATEVQPTVATPATPPAAPRNPYVVALVVIDTVLVALAIGLWAAGSAIASESGDAAAAGVLHVALWCLQAAGLVTLVVLTVQALRWRPPAV